MMTEARSVYHPEGDAKVRPHHRPLAIVGSHPKGLEKVPWDDLSVEIWVFNEAPMKPEKYPRWDALLQLHSEEVYSSPNNWVNVDHWEWLQKDHGKTIFMQQVDPRVPNSVAYPLEEILALTPYRYLRSSPAMALALAIYLGYPEISLYGSELSSNTEYTYQAINYAFWIGFAHGRGVNLHLECWQDEFNQPIYGYEGEMQLPKEVYVSRIAAHSGAVMNNKKAIQRLDASFYEATSKGDFARAGDLSVDMDTVYTITATAEAMLEEAERYNGRLDMISRQEFERRSAEGQRDGDPLRTQKDHACGIVEYTWNIWSQTGKLEALQQFRQFVKTRNQAAYEMGKQLGKYQENIYYLQEFDKRLAAAGGVRALGRETA